MMIYLLLLPITLIFGTTFFMLGRFSRRPTTSIDEAVTSEPKFMFFKDGKRIFPDHETISDVKHDCDTILQVLKYQGKLTDLMVVFKSRFNIVQGNPKESA